MNNRSFSHKQSRGIVPVSHRYIYKLPKGLKREYVKRVSSKKQEPDWMRKVRLEAFDAFEKKKVPQWGADLSEIDFEQLYYYLKPTKKRSSSWEEIPEHIRTTYDALGLPEGEQKFLAGVAAQFESEVVYKRIRKKLARKGVIFIDTDSALTEHANLFKKYFSTLVPPSDNAFAALNTALWSGGSFIYVPPKVEVEMPLQAFFLMNAPQSGQFERTLIIADEGSFVHYIEGCTAPVYTKASLHAAVVEVFVHRGARVRYTTVQNWSTNVYNLTTKRAWVDEDGIIEWVDVNLGSRVTMKYPACILSGQGARGEVLSLAYAQEGQHQDTGAKMIHRAPQTSSRIIAKSIVQGGGRSSYRGLVDVGKDAQGAKVYVSCDALLVDSKSRSDTYPRMNVITEDAHVQHEATVERIDEERLFYLSSRGINHQDAASLLVNGFIQPIVKEIPLEYAVEMNRLINLEMEGSVG